MTEASTHFPGGGPPPGRILSVDALRGMDMFWIVGAGGLVHALSRLGDSRPLAFLDAQLHHRAWEGFAFLDLIFPLFVFLAGMSVVFSLSRILQRRGRRAAYWRIIRRAVLLYLLGVFYYGGLAKSWPNVRLLGVLQRIAICYLVTGILFCHLDLKGLVASCAALLVGYWALMTFVPVPGVGAGCFEPGKNLANYLDARYLPGWKWDDTWDPEGLLSTIPAVGTCLIGIFAGMLIRTRAIPDGRKVLYLLGAGAAGVALGDLWGLQFPVIKKIWTSSYVLVAGGYSCIALGLFLLVIDVGKIRFWARPFIWIGMNPLAIYMADNIVDFGGIARRIAGGDVHRFLGHSGDVVLYLIALLAVFGLARFLYRRGIFIRA